MQCLLAFGGPHTLVGPMCWRLSRKIIFCILNNINIVDYGEPTQSQILNLYIHSEKCLFYFWLINSKLATPFNLHGLWRWLYRSYAPRLSHCIIVCDEEATDWDPNWILTPCSKRGFMDKRKESLLLNFFVPQIRQISQRFIFEEN